MSVTWITAPFAVRVIDAVAPLRLLEAAPESVSFATLARDRSPAAAVECVRVGPRDAATLPTLQGRWNLVVLAESLHLLPRETAEEIMDFCLERSDYTLVMLPLDRDAGHASAWSPADFSGPDVLGRQLDVTPEGRSLGAFLLSRDDPSGLADVFSAGAADAQIDAAIGARRAEADRALARASEQAYEVAFLKSKAWHRLGRRLQSSGAWNTVRWFKNRNRHVVGVRALGAHGPRSHDIEVWLLRTALSPGAHAIPWDFLEHGPQWHVKADPARPYGKMLCSRGGSLRIPADDDPELVFLSHPWSGMVEVSFRGRTETIDLYHPAGAAVTVRPARDPMVQGVLPTPTTTIPLTPSSRGMTKAEAAFVEAVTRDRPRAIAVSCPRWLGVTSSTRNLFEHVLPVPATADEDPYIVSNEDLRHHADVILQTGCPRVVFSGGDEYQHRLMLLLKARKPSLRTDMFLHASYPQFLENYTWTTFQMWLQSARSGLVGSIVHAKVGFDRFLHSLGVKSHVLLNRVAAPLMPAPILSDSPRHLGMWLSGSTYRKIPHAMLAALPMVQDIRLHAAGLDARALEVIEFLNIPRALVQEHQLPLARLSEEIRRTHLTLYVTFIECCPMLPLESLHLGVPCLLGPNSHLFEDHEYLFKRLVVPFPDRAEVIADYIETAIGEREKIVAEFAKYHPIYEARCRKSVEDYLND